MKVFTFLIPFYFIFVTSVDASTSLEKFESLKTIQENRKWLEGNLVEKRNQLNDKTLSDEKRAEFRKEIK